MIFLLKHLASLYSRKYSTIQSTVEALRVGPEEGH